VTPLLVTSACSHRAGSPFFLVSGRSSLSGAGVDVGASPAGDGPAGDVSDTCCDPDVGPVCAAPTLRDLGVRALPVCGGGWLSSERCVTAGLDPMVVLAGSLIDGDAVAMDRAPGR
jgi:hypothetical protein